jgi:pre-mRNA-splicing factor CWC26
MTLSSYLASKYLTADEPLKSSSKKRKRDKTSAANGLVIADDDDNSWATVATSADPSDDPLVVSKSAELRKSRKRAWKTVGAAGSSTSGALDVSAAAADDIIAAASAEHAAADAADDAAPAVLDPGRVMTDGTLAGLQSADAVAEQLERRRRAERANAQSRGAADGAGAETVYRDATGRRIDVAMRRRELRREEAERAARERAALDAQKGDVQLRQREARRDELDRVRFEGVARGVDDAAMNAELRGVARWNDPMAEFAPAIRAAPGRRRRRLYEGAAAPNRYGIRPGWRWDGVDRGNGWEAERFRFLNRTARNKELDFSWQVDT